MFANRLKTLRTERGLSQKQLGEELGLTQTAIASYETGTNVASVMVLNALADLFGVTVDYLIGRVDDHSKTSVDLLRALNDIPDLSTSYNKKEVSNTIKKALKIKNPFLNMSGDVKELLDLYNAQVDTTARTLDLLLGKMGKESGKKK